MSDENPFNNWRRKNKAQLLFATAAAAVTAPIVFYGVDNLASLFGGLTLLNAAVGSAMVALWPQPKPGPIAARLLPLSPTLH